jgi:uncharacterized membrane protein
VVSGATFGENLAMDAERSRAGKAGSPELANVVERNIQALVAHRQGEEGSRSVGERIADGVTRFTGSLFFVSIHLLILALWLLINLGWLPRIPRFDPSFMLLASVASVEALFLATFVLITQKRMAALADKRAELDLQISLLAEHEITRILTLVTAMAERMGVEGAQDPELAELSQDVVPEQVIEKMETQKRAHEPERRS